MVMVVPCWRGPKYCKVGSLWWPEILNLFIASNFNNFCVFLGPLMTQRWYVSGHMLFWYWDTFSVMKWMTSWRKSWLLSVISSSTCKYYWWSTNLGIVWGTLFSNFLGIIKSYCWSFISIWLIWWFQISVVFGDSIT